MSQFARARFPDLAAGYESFYLRACHPDGGLGVWIRYTTHRHAGAPPSGSLWCTLFEADGPVAAKLTAPDPETGGADWIRVAGGRIGPGAASGQIQLPDGPAVSWDLTFAGIDPLAHLPRPWMYRAPLPRTKPVSLHPSARFDGALTIADRRVDLAGWPGMVGHNWGTQHAERWIWLHGMGFPGDTWLDAVLARIKVAGRLTPWLASGAFSLNGKRFRLGGPFRRVRATETPNRLDFALPGATGLTVTGSVHAPPERFVGWRYADPDGSEHHTVNCSIADLDLSVSRHGESPVELSAHGLAAYELGMRERPDGITIQPFPDG
jgi:hypothetical protein